MIKLGYSTGDPHTKLSHKERIKTLLSIEKYAIEISFIVSERLKVKFDTEDINNIKKFEHISIHSPIISQIDKNSGIKKYIKYPSQEAEIIIDKLLTFAKKIKANNILFHPDLIDDFEWLNNRVGNLLAFENMDISKKFGFSIKDMEIVFQKSPQAKWVCDLNHIYTIDKSMKLAQKFHQAFGDRLAYYHLSGFGKLHDCFYISGEDEIMDGIFNFDKPIIHEGMALREGLKSLKKENDYVLNYLNK